METITDDDAHTDDDVEDRRDVCATHPPDSLVVEEPDDHERDTMSEEMPLPSASTPTTWQAQAITGVVSLLLGAFGGYQGARVTDDPPVIQVTAPDLSGPTLRAIQRVERNQRLLCVHLDVDCELPRE